MSRVKFNVNTEYAYIQNFKVLQSTYHFICLSVEKHHPSSLHTDTDFSHRHLDPTWNRSLSPRRTTRQMQTSRQSRVPPMVQTPLGSILPRPRVRRSRPPKSLRLGFLFRPCAYLIPHIDRRCRRSSQASRRLSRQCVPSSSPRCGSSACEFCITTRE